MLENSHRQGSGIKTMFHSLIISGRALKVRVEVMAGFIRLIRFGQRILTLGPLSILEFCAAPISYGAGAFLFKGSFDPKWICNAPF